MAREPKPNGIDVSELQYYFDAVERDSLDRISHSRRASEVLAIRDRLLTLPDKDFELAVQTIKNMLNPANSKETDPKVQQAKKQQAADLYEQTKAEKSASSLKVGPI